MGRTQRFFRFRTLENLHKSRLFRVERSTKRFRFRVSPVMTTSIPLHIKFCCGSVPKKADFECCTFDHSDNSPYLFSSVLSSKKLLENSLERKQERRQKIFDFEIFCVEEYQGESGGRNSQLLPKFRVSPVMTTSIPLRIADAAKLRRYYNSRQGKNQARIFLLHKSLACLTPFFVL